MAVNITAVANTPAAAKAFGANANANAKADETVSKVLNTERATEVLNQADEILAKKTTGKDSAVQRLKARFFVKQGRVQNEIANTRRLLESMGTRTIAKTTTSSPAITQALTEANATIDARRASIEALDQFLAAARDGAANGKVDLSAFAAPDSVAAELGNLADTTRPDELTYLASGGQVLLDAEQFTANKAGADGANWEANAENSLMIAREVAGSKVYSDAADTEANAARLDYKVSFEEAGTYYVWVRGTSQRYGDTDSNSVQIGLNGEMVSERGGVRVDERRMDWGNRDNFSNQRVAIEVTEPGTMTFNMWVREDGTAVDAILLTKDANYTPVGVRGLSISDMTTTKGAAGAVSLADVEAIVADARAGLEADIAEAQTFIANNQTTEETIVRTTEENPYLQAVLEAQQRGLQQIQETAERERADFVKKFGIGETEASNRTFVNRALSATALFDSNAGLTELFKPLTLDKEA